MLQKTNFYELQYIETAFRIRTIKQDKIMREQIFSYLNQAVKLYSEISLIHSGKLSPIILDGSKRTIEQDIPKQINNFISTINTVEQAKVYSEIKTIQEGIELFSNPQLETSIQNAIKNTNFLTSNQKSPKETLEFLQDAVRRSVQLLKDQINIAKLD